MLLALAALAALGLIALVSAGHEEAGRRALFALAVVAVVFWASYQAGRDAAMYTLAREPIPAVIHDVAVYRLKIMQSQASEQAR